MHFTDKEDAKNYTQTLVTENIVTCILGDTVVIQPNSLGQHETCLQLIREKDGFVDTVFDEVLKEVKIALCVKV